MDIAPYGRRYFKYFLTFVVISFLQLTARFMRVIMVGYDEMKVKFGFLFFIETFGDIENITISSLKFSISYESIFSFLKLTETLDTFLLIAS